MAATAPTSTSSCYLCGAEARLVDLGGLPYWKCGSCGLIARRDREVEAAYYAETYGEAYYADAESYPQWDTDPELRRVLEDRVLALGRLRPERGLLLDVGCGLGHFLQAAARDGWTVSGTEPSPYAASVASERVGGAVYPDLDGVKAAGLGPFQCATLWDVLEHDADPLGLLRALHASMSPGATLAVSMPNRAGLEARLRGDRWRYFRPEFGHVTHHTPSTLSRLVRLAGFEVAMQRTEGALNVYDRLRPRVPPAVAQAVQGVLDRAAGAAKLGRNMTLYARRG